MKLNCVFLFFLFLLESCAPFKKELVQIGGSNEAIQNAIVDFSNTSGLYKKDSVFLVSIHNPLHDMILEETLDGNMRWIEGLPYHGVLAVSIIASNNKILLPEKVKIGEIGVKMPTRYFERNGKIFYWWDDNQPITEKTLSAFEKYDLLIEYSLEGLIEFNNFSIDDAQKGVHYYFCKTDLTSYQKVTTNKAIGYYAAPKLKCI